MSFEALNTRLKEIASNLDRLMPDVIAQSVMLELKAMHNQRIFDKGLRTDGSDIGTYSDAPAYFAKEQFIRKSVFKGIGKPNKIGKRKTGNKTMFIATGYAGFRDMQGRRSDRKNLKYSGSLEKNLEVQKFGNSVLYGTTNLTESKKFEALEEEYDVFGLSGNEKQFVKEEIKNQAVVVAKKR
jgi:hypothetical protein